MKRLLLALMCAAPLATGVPVEEVQTPLPQETPAMVELAFCPSMGCDLENCTDPDHYHYCLAGCTDATHYHNCPVGCADPTHPHCGQCWEDGTEEVLPPCYGGMGYGHHGGRRGHHGRWRY